MNLPYVIDNRTRTLADVLNDLLRSDAVHALDVATAYVNVGAFDLVQDGLDDLASLRLLLGSEPGADDLGLSQALRHDLDEAPFDQETYRQVETLIRFLRRERVAVRLYERGFLHAKAYLCFADQAPGDRFTPVAGIVGSSNFTRAGLTTNQELNLTHKSVAEDSAIDEAETDDIEDWLDGPFIKWHVKLYKRCPVIWQLSSGDYYHTFNCFVYYHKLDADTLRKVQTLYLWPRRRAIESKLDSARRDQQEGVSGASSRIEEAEGDLEVLAAFEDKLVGVIEGKAPYRPPDWAEGPIRNGIYDPVLDDGVKVNIMPLQKGRILRYKRLV